MHGDITIETLFRVECVVCRTLLGPFLSREVLRERAEANGWRVDLATQDWVC